MLELRDGGSVSVNIGIFWGIGIGIGIGWIEKYSIGIGKNNTNPPSLLSVLILLYSYFHKGVHLSSASTASKTVSSR